jgi:hypothetical protein
MDHLSEIPQTLSRMLYLLRLCDPHRDVEGYSELLGGVHDQLRMTLRDVEDSSFLRHCSASFSMDHKSAVDTAGDGTVDLADDDATDATPTIISKHVTAINQDFPSKKRKRAGTEWTSLDLIVEKVACPDEIFEALMTRAGKFASQTSRVRYLTHFFFHFAGPHAFEQVRDSFSAIHCTKEIDLITLGGHVRALDRFVLAQPIQKRALLVCLCSERSGLQTCAKSEGEGYPDRAALNQKMTSAYPSLKSSSKGY